MNLEYEVWKWENEEKKNVSWKMKRRKSSGRRDFEMRRINRGKDSVAGKMRVWKQGSGRKRGSV